MEYQVIFGDVVGTMLRQSVDYYDQQVNQVSAVGQSAYYTEYPPW